MSKRVMTRLQKDMRLRALIKRRRKIQDNKKGIQEAENLIKYRFDVLHEIPPKATPIQHNEINGKLPFDDGQYH